MDGLVGLMAKAPDYLVAISGIIASLTVLTAITPTKMGLIKIRMTPNDDGYDYSFGTGW